MAKASSGRSFTAAERRVVLAALMITFLLGALDQTIVSTAMPRIAAELHGLPLYTWVTAGYLVSSTVTIPIYGKLSDLFGRKPVLLTGVSIFALGSALCGLAGAIGSLPLLGGGMTQLIVFRALQGIGGGALFTSAFIVIADLYPERQRGRLSGLFGAVFGVASVLGPVVGGVLADMGAVRLFGVRISGWRWVFYVNLPLCLTALALLLFRTPELSKRVRGTLDWLGAVLLIATFGPLLLGLSLAGQSRDWGSPAVMLLLAVAALSLTGFVIVESRVRYPLISLDLFTDKVFVATNAIGLLTNMAFIGVVTFLPLYLQLGQGVAPTVSGLALIPLVLGLILSAALTGFLATLTGRYKPFVLAGAILIGLGAFCLTGITPQMKVWDIAWRVALLGIGVGPMQSLLSLAVQNSVERSKVGVATGASQFFREMGSTVGVAVLGTVLNLTLAARASTAPAPKGEAAGATLTLSDLESVAAAGQGGGDSGLAHLTMADRMAITHAIQDVMIAVLIVSVMAAAVAAIMPGAKLKSRRSAS